jgi:hypothetical protein
MAQPTSFVRTRVRDAVDRVLVRVRGALDLPSRAEMIDLTDRLEQLDRRIAELAAARVADLSRAAPALPEPAPPPEPDAAPSERARKNGARRSAAARTAKK